MSYQSLQFLAFAGVVTAVYYLAGRKRQLAVLALANLAFYAVAGLRYLPFLLATMVATFFAARWIDRVYRASEEAVAACSDAAEKKRLRAAAKARAKRALGVGIAVPIALLVACKYTGFLLENLNALLRCFGLPETPMFAMILPVGISFYTFMALSYVLDVYWKRYRAEESFLLYAVYLSYFPHVVQGPIDRFNEFRDQLRAGVSFDYQTFTFGAQLALWGFFKKLVIADRLGMFVDAVFGHWSASGGALLAIAVAAYSIQIYADFSGCIDIVTGVSEMLGIRLRKNFNHPYFSRTMGEFWRRWHISLQEWFKDYVYFPVSASNLVRKVKKACKAKGKPQSAELFAACFPIFVVWMITGIWHGAAWKFVAWGVFHAMLLIGSRLLEPAFAAANRRLRIDPDRLPWRLWQMLRTFVLCCVGRVFFRADDLRAAFGIFAAVRTPRISLAQLLRPGFDIGMNTPNAIIAAVSMLILLIVDIAQERTRVREALSRRNIALRWALIYACLFFVLYFGVYGPWYGKGGFIYEQF